MWDGFKYPSGGILLIISTKAFSWGCIVLFQVWTDTPTPQKLGTTDINQWEDGFYIYISMYSTDTVRRSLNTYNGIETRLHMYIVNGSLDEKPGSIDDTDFWK